MKILEPTRIFKAAKYRCYLYPLLIHYNIDIYGIITDELD